MKYLGVIFDLDGVLCSTDEFHYLAWKELGESIGIFNFTREDNHRLRGISRMESLEILLEKTDRKFSYEEKVKLAERKNAIYRNLLSRMSEKDLLPGALALLQELKAKNIKIAIGSSSKNAKFILEKLGILNIFDAVSDGNNIKKSKPDPEVFLKAAETLNLEPKDLIVVEDARAGIDAAIAGGFTAVAIGAASDYEKAELKIEKLQDLIAIIEK